MKDKISRCKYVWILSIVLASSVHAAGVDPSLTTPDEQSKQRQLDAQEQQRKQEILKSLREQHEVKPDVRDEVEALNKRRFLRKSFNYIDDTEIEVQRRRTAGWELGLKPKLPCTLR